MSARLNPEGFDLARNTFVPASAILQNLHDRAPTGPVTLRWVMTRLRQQSFGVMMLISGIVATAPGISLLAGVLLLVAAFQMMLGHSELNFPGWLAERELPTRQIGAVVQRAIPILVHLERAIYPRLAIPAEPTKRVVGLVIFMLAVRLLLTPFPLSNIPPAVMIAIISLTYLEQDGLLLIVALLTACVFLVVEFAAIWQLLQHAKWIRDIV
jgi:hypothetical protein